MAVVFSTMAMCFFASCGEDAGSDISASDSLHPTMTALNVVTLVSDSGVTRFRATTAEWYVFNSVKQPYWTFPAGLHLERFNTNMEVESNVYADSAFYDVNKKLWRLDGNVKVMNLKGERFETDQLFWDQSAGKVYSDHKIDIHQKECIITGHGFVSNEQMTNYVINHPEGIIPVNDK